MTLQTVKTRFITALAGAGSYDLTEALFLKLLGLIYLFAFGSLWPQIVGLVGSRGVAPASRLLNAMHAELGSRAFYYVPSLFWLNMSNAALVFLCAAGCVSAVLLVLGIFRRLTTIACFLLYLSLSSIGQPFTGFQWDAMLLEAGFLAIFAGASWLVWAYRLLLFRLMFESGWVKLASHDPNWRNFHALRFHFVTQPLPNPLAYYCYRLPVALLDALTVFTLTVELIVPFLLFGPRRARQIAVAFLMLLQIVILLTGNYAFFNLLTLALCLWGLDDRAFKPLARSLHWRFPRVFLWRDARTPRAVGNLVVAAILLLGTLQLFNTLAPATGSSLPKPLAVLQPFEIVNSYGLFAIMTTTRPEIIIEGSNDNVTWREYQFVYKPGNTHRGLPWVAPYQPRLDWQMWFAALGDYGSNTWVSGLMYRILTGEPSVCRLLAPPPFDRPPKYMRALLYQYDFTTLNERTRSGAVWMRHLQGVWFGPVSLTGQ